MILFPLRTGTAEDGCAIRTCLTACGFSELAVRARFSVPTLDALTPASVRAFAAVDEPIDVLAALFLLGRQVTAGRVARAIPAAPLRAFLATDLLRVDAETEYIRSPVRLVPIALDTAVDVLIASDAPPSPEAGSPAEDFVFSADNPLTRQFLQLAPRGARRALLDLGAGTGVAAIAGADASVAVAVDITERAAHFARFNAWLNDRAIEVGVGDLYAPVAGRLFDCVVAHPPYVPTLKARATYRDGGENGELVTRRVVEGLPDHLCTGGVLLMPSISMDTVEGKYEERVRGWLGGAADEFDVVFAVAEAKSPQVFASDLASRVRDPAEDEAAQWIARFGQWGVQQVTYGALAARRFDASQGPPQTRRVKLADETRFDAFERLFACFDQMRQPEYEQAVLASTPRISSDARLTRAFSSVDGRLVLSDCLVENAGQPFPTRLKVDAWVAAFLEACDGRTAVRDLAARALAHGGAEGISVADIVQLVTLLQERGVIEL